MLKAGAILDAETFEAGKTPLYTAIMQKKTAVAKELIRRGANVNGIQQQARNYLHTAWYSGQPEIVIALVKAGYDLQAEHWIFAQDMCDLTSEELDTLVWLQQQKYNARRLTDICCISLRQILYGGDLCAKVEQLHLPKSIKESLKMQDL